MSEEELTLQMGAKAEGYEENMQDYNYTPVTQEEIQEYSEEPIEEATSYFNEQAEQIYQDTRQTRLELTREVYKDNFLLLLPYIGLTFSILLIFIIIKEYIKSKIWNK